ncbi:hypothetical protein KCV02_g4291, partial [Aureobasidium melanogenum]
TVMTAMAMIASTSMTMTMTMMTMTMSMRMPPTLLPTTHARLLLQFLNTTLMHLSRIAPTSLQTSMTK